MSPDVKAILVARYDPTPLPSEMYAEIARQRIACAVASCEVWKKWMDFRLKHKVRIGNGRG